MAQNLELKAYYLDLEVAREACQRLGAEIRSSSLQRDTYFAVRGRLKFRETRGRSSALIAYKRADTPLLRESRFEILPFESSSNGQRLKKMLADSLGIRGEVLKHRDVYVLDSTLINIDRVQGIGNFIEIEVDIKRSGGNRKAKAIANKISRDLGISPGDGVSWSYIDLLKMYEVADRWRNKLLSAKRPGTLILLDGASGTGKTTLSHILLQDEKLDLAFIPRFSTRKPRPHETTESEYVFVTREDFEERAQNGNLLEYRDFDFGMSYGLAWEYVVPPLLEGRNALAIINWGNVRHVKKVFPEALTVLIDASPNTIRERLVRRGVNNNAQITERLSSAANADYYRPYYDHTINNEEGNLEEAAADLKQLILRKTNKKITKPRRKQNV